MRGYGRGPYWGEEPKPAQEGGDIPVSAWSSGALAFALRAMSLSRERANIERDVLDEASKRLFQQGTTPKES